MERNLWKYMMETYFRDKFEYSLDSLFNNKLLSNSNNEIEYFLANGIENTKYLNIAKSSICFMGI